VITTVKRREFITLLGGAAAVSWPEAVWAQRAERVRRIGVLLGAAADDPQFQPWLGAFLQELAILGWTIGRNVKIDTRWAPSTAELNRHAVELVALAPDAILAHGASAVGPLVQATRSVPIIFPIMVDPTGMGFVDSLARPGGNVTGFMAYEYSLSGKWLELLKEIAPGVTRAAVFRDLSTPAGIGQFSAIQSVAPSLGIVRSTCDELRTHDRLRKPSLLQQRINRFTLWKQLLILPMSQLGQDRLSEECPQRVRFTSTNRHQSPRLSRPVSATSRHSPLLDLGDPRIRQNRSLFRAM
jgi:putative ABC transport system substrate-binding protein